MGGQYPQDDSHKEIGEFKQTYLGKGGGGSHAQYGKCAYWKHTFTTFCLPHHHHHHHFH